MALERIDRLKRNGRSVFEGTGQIGNLWQDIPLFKEAPFSIEDKGENKYLRLIVREPLKGGEQFLFPSDTQDELHIPVATVSKQYEQVQHRHIEESLEMALKRVGFNPEHLEARLTLTEYGECMRISFFLPYNSPYAFNLGHEDHVLQINALNSVDKSTKLEINLMWYGLNSQTGMPARQGARLTKLHVKSPKSLESAIKGFLEVQLAQASEDIQQFRMWYEIKVSYEKLSHTKPSPGQIENWIESFVTQRWGKRSAARVFHIARVGRDVDGPHELRYANPDLSSFAPVRNAFDISQVLSWVANQEGTIQSQLARRMDIPDLMDALIKTEKPLTLTV